MQSAAFESSSEDSEFVDYEEEMEKSEGEWVWIEFWALIALVSIR